MPIPMKGQSKEDFFKICIPELKGEGKEDDQVIAQCNGIWEQHLKESDLLLEGIRPLFGSPGGKKYLAKFITGFIPDHETYIEPFCGDAAVFFSKKPSSNEILSDMDSEVAFTLEKTRNITETEIESLKEKNWKYSDFEKIKTLKEKRSDGNDIDRMYDFLYFRMGSRGGMGTHIDSGQVKRKPDSEIKVAHRIPGVKERLENVKIFNKDYSEIIKEFDNEKAFVYLDPPYPGTDKQFKNKIKASELLEVVKSIKGKFMLSLNSSKDHKRMFSDFFIKKIKHGNQLAKGGDASVSDSQREELLISNFELEKTSDWLIESLKSIPLEDMESKGNYNPDYEWDSELLTADFRFLSACYAKQKDGDDTEFKTVDNIIKTSVKVIQRILELDEVTFHSDQMKAESIELLRESLGRIIKAGPYLAPPHGELVWKDKQKSIVRVTENKKLENMGLLSSGQLVYGFIRFYPPEDIDLNEFKESDNDHRMTEAELGKDPARFLYYRVREFIPFETPKQSDIPDPFLRDDERFFESTSMPKDWDLGSLTIDELLKIHSMVHDDATQFSLTTSNPPDEGLIGRHKLITSEFKKHNMGHLVLSELDKLSENINMDGSIQLKQLSNSLKEGISIRRPLLSFIGKSCSSGWGKKVDIHIDWPVHDTKFIDMIKFDLQALLPPKLKESFNLVSDYKGPDVDFIPFAEMVLKVIPIESRIIMKMASSDISADTLREARINDVKMKRQAEQSRKEDKVELFRFFMQISNVPGVSPPVANTIDEMIKAVNERWVKGNKFPQIQVLQKFGETRAQIHTAGPKVLILDENGKDVTDSFPLIVEEASKQGSDFIVDVNITNDPKAGIHIANIFDAVLILEDIHNKPLSERRSLLENLKSGKHFDIADRELVKSESTLKIALKNASNLPGSQGAVIKLWDGKYPLEGSSSKWMRLKK